MNWDYRYCWPRDAALTLSAFIACGFGGEADAFFGWLMSAANTSRPYLNVLYDLYGRHDVPERTLLLDGYGHARPVRVGNRASVQTQHDVYGEVLLAIEDWIRHFGRPQTEEQDLIANFGKAVARTWRRPDYGIWEIRDRPQHYTYSKAMCWYVFDALIRMHAKGCLDPAPVERYRQEREALRKEIEQRGFNRRRNCFTGVFDGDTTDASLLLLPRCGFVAYNDPRMLGTWDAIQADLGRDGLILRYPPGFGGSEPGEGAFVVCNFWAVDYLTGCGRRAEAEAYLHRLLRLANDVGLFSEGVDPATLEMTGNMPQAFSHASLINSIIKLYGQAAESVAA